MSKIDYKYDNYIYLRSLLSVGAVMVLFSLVILFPTNIFALTQTLQVTPQGSNHAGYQQLNLENRMNSANFLNINSYQANSPLIITTDKTVYSPGETVNVTITNTGIEPLTFPNAALGLTIRNVATNQTYPILSAQMITTLDGNESNSVTWGPISSNTSEVPPGDYVASVTSGGSTEDVIFTISG